MRPSANIGISSTAPGLVRIMQLSLPEAHARLAELARSHGLHLGEYAQATIDHMAAADARSEGAAEPR